MNRRKPDQPKLTLLPFLMRAMVKAIAEQPQLNASMTTMPASSTSMPACISASRADAVGPDGAGGRMPRRAASGIAPRVNRWPRPPRRHGNTRGADRLDHHHHLAGRMGGIVTTPVINYPEVAIVGVNKIMIRPVWDGSQFVPRKMMNLSSSFDHRVIDGWDAAVFVQRIKALLERPR
jgi:2-oxoisovalerate dehydrogenase E2 component (dihydrolipoyl transacylase)